jgi:hypothetical protein
MLRMRQWVSKGSSSVMIPRMIYKCLQISMPLMTSKALKTLKKMKNNLSKKHNQLLLLMTMNNLSYLSPVWLRVKLFNKNQKKSGKKIFLVLTYRFSNYQNNNFCLEKVRPTSETISRKYSIMLKFNKQLQR